MELIPALYSRFQWLPPWMLHNRGWIPEYFGRVHDGCDEWHNKSKYVIVPFLGQVVVFYEKKFSREGPEHLFYMGPEGTEGLIIEDCEICQEVLADFKRDY